MEPMKPMKPLKFSEIPRWWPEDLGEPNSAGSQNDVQYAYFSAARRLLLRDGAQITTYDTGDHAIQGVSQASDAAHATFTSNHGVVNLSELKRL
jgi:hypothetical protein